MVALKQQLAAGGPKMGAEKLIIRSEKVRFIDILSMLFLRRPITSYPFVEAGDQTAADFGSTPGDWFVALTQLIQKALAGAYYPALMIGAVVEFLLNFIALNNGILGIFLNIFRCTHTHIYTHEHMINLNYELVCDIIQLNLHIQKKCETSQRP
jgi:hypothetical protein